MYVGAIFRLRVDDTTPVKLAALREYFNFSPISIHEMVQKLVSAGLIRYIPYHGVQLTPKGETVATSIIRRHRIWERFLTDQLGIPANSVHEIADHLEHAAPELVTERLSKMIGAPKTCPHGSVIPPPGFTKSR